MDPNSIKHRCTKDVPRICRPCGRRGAAAAQRARPRPTDLRAAPCSASCSTRARDAVPSSRSHPRLQRQFNMLQHLSTKRSRENSANTSRLRSFSQDLSASASFVNAIAGTRSRCPGHEKKLDFVQTGHARAHDIAQDSVEKEFFLAICFTDAGKVPSIV